MDRSRRLVLKDALENPASRAMAEGVSELRAADVGVGGCGGGDCEVSLLLLASLASETEREAKRETLILRRSSRL